MWAVAKQSSVLDTAMGMGRGTKLGTVVPQNDVKWSLFKQQVWRIFCLSDCFSRGKGFNILCGFNCPYYGKVYWNYILLLSLNSNMLSYDRQKISNINKAQKDQDWKQVKHDDFLEPVNLFPSVNSTSWPADYSADLVCSRLVFSSKCCQLTCQKVRNWDFSLTGFLSLGPWDPHLVMMRQERGKQLMLELVVKWCISLSIWEYSSFVTGTFICLSGWSMHNLVKPVKIHLKVGMPNLCWFFSPRYQVVDRAGVVWIEGI